MSSVVKDTKEAAANQPNQNNNSKKAPSKQELTNCRIEYEKKRTFAILLDDTLRKVRQKPSLYNNPHLKPLRQFCEHRDNNKELYLGIVEETTPLLPNNGGKPVVDLTPNYIQTMANYADTSNIRNPTLQVVSAETKFRNLPFKKVFGKPQQDVKITHLRLMDGDNNVMMGGCAMNIIDEGKKLNP